MIGTTAGKYRIIGQIWGFNAERYWRAENRCGQIRLAQGHSREDCQLT
jgi:hypothetical protein